MLYHFAYFLMQFELLCSNSFNFSTSEKETNPLAMAVARIGNTL